MSEFQLIDDETPRDGTPILAKYKWLGKDRYCVVSYSKLGPFWILDGMSKVVHDESKDTYRNWGLTHWKPLP